MQKSKLLEGKLKTNSISNSYLYSEKTVTIPIKNTPGASIFCWHCFLRIEPDPLNPNLSIPIGDDEREGTFCSDSCRLAYIDDKTTYPDLVRYKNSRSLLLSEVRNTIKPSLPRTALKIFGGSLDRKTYSQIKDKCNFIRKLSNSISFDICAIDLPLDIMEYDIYSQ